MVKEYHEVEYPSQGVRARSGLYCTDCQRVMFKNEGVDSYHESQEFKCVDCGKNVALNIPTSGDVI